MQDILSEYTQKFDLTKTLEESDIEKIYQIRDSALEKITDSENDKELFDDCNSLLKKYYTIRKNEVSSKVKLRKEGIEYGLMCCLGKRIFERKPSKFIRLECYNNTKELYNLHFNRPKK